MRTISKIIKEILREAPIDAIQNIGDFEKGHSFSDKRDRELLKNDTSILKIKDFFKNTSTDFDFYFVNLKGRSKFREKGKASEDFVFDSYPNGLGINKDQLKNGKINENNITVFFVGNTAAEKIPMTPWTIAHRFGHSIKKEYAFEEVLVREWLEKQFEELLGYYNINKSSFNSFTYGKIKSNLFNQIGTMRSARLGKIKREYEFYYELFAQYLNTGSVKFNHLNERIVVGFGPYGRKQTSRTNRLEYVNDVLSGIERDFHYYAEDVLSNCVGNIYIM